MSPKHFSRTDQPFETKSKNGNEQNTPYYKPPNITSIRQGGALLEVEALLRRSREREHWRGSEGSTWRHASRGLHRSRSSSWRSSALNSIEVRLQDMKSTLIDLRILVALNEFELVQAVALLDELSEGIDVVVLRCILCANTQDVLETL